MFLLAVILLVPEVPMIILVLQDLLILSLCMLLPIDGSTCSAGSSCLWLCSFYILFSLDSHTVEPAEPVEPVEPVEPWEPVKPVNQ